MAHSEICAVPAERLEAERELLAALPSLRPAIGAARLTRKVDRLSCVRFGSARYSVPNRLIGTPVAVTESGGRLLVIGPRDRRGRRRACPGRARARLGLDEHYGGPRPAPRRAARPRTAAEKAFLALGPVAEAFLDRRGAPGDHPAGRETWTRWPPCAPRTATRRSGRAGAGGGVPPLAGRRRPLDPGRRGRAPAARARRGGPGRSTCPRSPVRPLSDYTIGGRVMTAHRTAAAGRGPDAGLSRLKLAAMRRLAPELLVTAQDPAVEPRGVPAHPGRGRDHRPGRVQRPRPG